MAFSKIVVYKLLFVYFIIIPGIFCKKMSLPDFNSLGSESIGECQRCKILTESFNYWLEKTSRGKYEGGDAAWEEAKLKSYARSEMRLVEVQEGLCSEVKKHQEHCYNLAEDAEQPLEKWWFNEDPNSVDLYTWLCIETLQYCCPDNHFGDSCKPCPLYENKICAGEGKCDGEGTRKGNGTCICNKGFTGSHCEACSKNFYRTEDNSCKRCHKACDGCSGEGAAACTNCKKGWALQSGVCQDIDECLEPEICKSKQYCVNREGSHTCKNCHSSCNTCIGSEPSNCTSCEASHVLWSGMCVDDQQKSELLQDALKRIALYFGLLIINLIVYRRSKTLASLVILVLAIYIYYSESISKNNILDIFSNLYLM